MTSDEKAKLVITPATWENRAERLERTPTNLWHGVGWYGSTHTAATWRKAADFLAVFRKKNIYGFDPQVTGDWQPSFATIEAEVLATASVIIIRLENNELLNGSLGSIAEIGLALTSAALRGQIVIVSIEDGLLTSLDDPGAIAQYMLLEMSLEHVVKVPDLARFLRIHRGNNLAELARLACEVAEQQQQVGQATFDFNSFLAKKARRKQNYPLRVLLGGSGGAYSEAHAQTFQKKREKLTSAYLIEGHPVKILSQGAIAQAWSIPYGSLDPVSVALAMRALLTIELEFKQEADLLLMAVMAEAESKAAATEIGFLLLHALTTGQDIKVFLEPFDPVDYVAHKLKEVNLNDCNTEKLIRAALQQAGVADSILALATKPEVTGTFEIFKALKSDQPPSFKQVKQSLLGATAIFLNADNVRRVRFLVQAHLEKLSTDERFPDFFTYVTEIGP